MGICGILIKFKVTSVYVTASWLGAGIGCNNMKTWETEVVLQYHPFKSTSHRKYMMEGDIQVGSVQSQGLVCYFSGMFRAFVSFQNEAIVVKSFLTLNEHSLYLRLLPPVLILFLKECLLKMI